MDIETIGTGAGSGIIGALLAFLGLRTRLNRIETELDDKVNEKTCSATYAGLEKLMHTQMELQKETRDDVKQLLAK